MTASTDLTAPGAGLATSSVDAGPAQEIAGQMADVAGAMFALLLLQAPELPVHPDVLDPPAEPAQPPVVLETRPVSVPMPPVPALAVTLPVLDEDPSPIPAGIPSIAMPTSIPMPDLAPQLGPLHEAPPTAPDAIPMISLPPAPTMAMLSEIEFLDE